MDEPRGLEENRPAEVIEHHLVRTIQRRSIDQRREGLTRDDLEQLTGRQSSDEYVATGIFRSADHRCLHINCLYQSDDGWQVV